MSHAGHVAPGAVLLGKYRVDRILGTGGMGTVVAATHLHLKEQVAIKFLLPELLSNPEIVHRFLQEAQATVRLKGEHVARVGDVGILPDGPPFLVMEYLEGLDLGVVITQRGALPSGEAVDYLLQACEALAEAHSLGIVHRDIKPANLFITQRPDGSPLLKVLDFGISKMPEAIDHGLTRTQSVLGTPSYMSPEQMRSSRNVDSRTDIWSLGIVLYESLTGKRPFHAESFAALCLMVGMDPVPPIALGSLPKGIDRIVYQCLEKDPKRRFSTVAALASALAPYAATPRAAAVVVERTQAIVGSAIGSMATIVDVATALPTVDLSAPTLDIGAAELAPRRRRRGLAVAGAAIGIGALLSLLGVVIARDHQAGKDIDSAIAPIAAPDPGAPVVVDAATTAPSATAAAPVQDAGLDAAVSTGAAPAGPTGKRAVSSPPSSGPPRRRKTPKPEPRQETTPRVIRVDPREIL